MILLRLLSSIKMCLYRFFPIDITLNILPNQLSNFQELKIIFPNYLNLSEGKYIYSNVIQKQEILDSTSLHKLGKEYKVKPFDEIIDYEFIDDESDENEEIYNKNLKKKKTINFFSNKVCEFIFNEEKNLIKTKGNTIFIIKLLQEKVILQ